MADATGGDRGPSGTPHDTLAVVDRPRHSPLHERHLAAGARMALFGGWQMPVDFPGGGVLREHAAVRETVGVFDVSHLGKASVRGPGARGYVNSCLTNDLDRIAPGQAQYTMCCDDETGGIVDDLIVYLHGDQELFLVPNAANTAEVVRRLTATAPAGVQVHGQHEDFGLLAVQGPRSDEVLDAVRLPHGHRYMSFVPASWYDRPVVVCRSGYTGERGYELVVGWRDSGPLWDALLGAARSVGGLPCGLGARDTLRTEMGYPLHGQDIGPDVTPVQARAGWAVGWQKTRFWGRPVLLAERRSGAHRTLLGLRAADRAIPRPGMTVTGTDHRAVGRVTSGTFSPTARVGIGLALLDRSVAPGQQVMVDLRGRAVPMQVATPPFVAASPR